MPPTTLTLLQGQIERITYTNDETGYTVAKVKVYGHRDLVTVIGAIVNPTPGEVIRLKGEWGQPVYRGDPGEEAGRSGRDEEGDGDCRQKR
jgi:hypothetical protein